MEGDVFKVGDRVKVVRDLIFHRYLGCVGTVLRVEKTTVGSNSFVALDGGNEFHPHGICFWEREIVLAENGIQRALRCIKLATE